LTGTGTGQKFLPEGYPCHSLPPAAAATTTDKEDDNDCSRQRRNEVDLAQPHLQLPTLSTRTTAATTNEDEDDHSISSKRGAVPRFEQNLFYFVHFIVVNMFCIISKKV